MISRLIWLVLLGACPGVASSPDAGPDASMSPDASAPLSDAGSPTTDQGFAELVTGLWVGPGSMTPLGSFPVMLMDIRPAGNVVFGQAEVDNDNTLRFGFALDSEGLAYRNGGFFQGNLRDSLARLVSADSAKGATVSVNPIGDVDISKQALSLASRPSLLTSRCVGRPTSSGVLAVRSADLLGPCRQSLPWNVGLRWGRWP